MILLEIILPMLVSLLAVLGAYGILRELMLSAVASRQVTVAVVLREPVDEEALDILLDEALRHPRRRRGQRIALVLARPLVDGAMGEAGELSPRFAALAERYAAEVFVADALSGTVPD